MVDRDLVGETARELSFLFCLEIAPVCTEDGPSVLTLGATTFDLIPLKNLDCWYESLDFAKAYALFVSCDGGFRSTDGACASSDFWRLRDGCDGCVGALARFLSSLRLS